MNHASSVALLVAVGLAVPCHAQQLCSPREAETQSNTAVVSYKFFFTGYGFSVGNSTIGGNAKLSASGQRIPPGTVPDYCAVGSDSLGGQTGSASQTNAPTGYTPLDGNVTIEASPQQPLTPPYVAIANSNLQYVASPGGMSVATDFTKNLGGQQWKPVQFGTDYGAYVDTWSTRGGGVLRASWAIEPGGSDFDVQFAEDGSYNWITYSSDYAYGLSGAPHGMYWMGPGWWYAQCDDLGTVTLGNHGFTSQVRLFLTAHYEDSSTSTIVRTAYGNMGGGHVNVSGNLMSGSTSNPQSYQNTCYGDPSIQVISNAILAHPAATIDLHQAVSVDVTLYVDGFGKLFGGALAPEVGDLNRDGSVTPIGDRGLLIAIVGTDVTTDTLGKFDIRADFNGDGVIDSADLAAFDAAHCYADFNGVGGVTTQDLFDYLNAWFAGDLSADTNGDGSLSTTDMFSFMSLWFAGC